MTEYFRETRKAVATPNKHENTRDIEGFEDTNGFDFVIKREDEVLIPDPDRVGVRNIRTTVMNSSAYSPKPSRTLYQENYQTFSNANPLNTTSYFKPEQTRTANYSSAFKPANPFHAEKPDYHDPLIRSDHRSPYNHLTHNPAAIYQARPASPYRTASPYRQTSTFVVDAHTLHRAHDHLDRLDDLAKSQERDINYLLGNANKPDFAATRGYSPSRTTYLERSAERTVRTDPGGFHRATRDPLYGASAEVLYHDADLLPKLLTDYPELRKKEIEFKKLNDEKDINDSLLNISKNLLEEAKASLTRIRGASAIRNATPSKSAKPSPAKPSSSSYTSIRLNTVDNEKKHLKDDHNIDLDKIPTSSHNTPSKQFASTQNTPTKTPPKPVPATNSSAYFNPVKPAPPANPQDARPVPAVQPGAFAAPQRPPVVATSTTYTRTAENPAPAPAPAQTRAVPPPPMVSTTPKPPANERESFANRSSEGYPASRAPNQTQIEANGLGSQINPSTYQANSTTYGAGPDGPEKRSTEVKEDKTISPDGTVTTTVKRTTVTTSNYEDDYPVAALKDTKPAPAEPVKTTYTNSSYNYDIPSSQGNNEYNVTRKVTTTTYENEVPRTSYTYSRNY